MIEPHVILQGLLSALSVAAIALVAGVSSLAVMLFCYLLERIAMSYLTRRHHRPRERN